MSFYRAPVVHSSRCMMVYWAKDLREAARKFVTSTVRWCRFVASITLLTHAGLSFVDQFAGFWTQRPFGELAQLLLFMVHALLAHMSMAPQCQ